MTHSEWVVSRAPGAPRALIECLTVLLEEHPEWRELSRADALMLASEALACRVLSADVSKRENALDLLTADACVTFVFEAAADEPATLDARAQLLQRRIASLVPLPELKT